MQELFGLLKTHDPNGGLYVHLLQPKSRISEPGKVIEPGMSVIKPGKFRDKLSGRIKIYDSPKYWHFSDGTSAFRDVTTHSFLIYDATNLPEEHKWLITGLEEKLKQLIFKKFTIIQKIGKGNSEYLEIQFVSDEDYISKIQSISQEINNLANQLSVLK